MTRSLPFLVVLLAGVAGVAHAQPAPAPGADESVLGTIVVDGSAGAAALPKLAMVPVEGTGSDGAALELVAKDLDRIGLYDVVTDRAKLPEGTYGADEPLDAKAWKAKGYPYLVRVKKVDAPKPALVAEAWILAKGDAPIFTQTIEIDGDARLASHKAADAILSGFTGRSGPFASRIAYAKRVGKGRQVFVAAYDGHGAVAYGSPNDTALAPTFGPEAEVYYTVSKNYAPFTLVHGKNATPVPLPGVKGSVLSVAFSPDKSKMAVAAMAEDTGALFLGKSDGTGLAPIAEGAKLPNRPAFGPLDKLAWVSSSGTQRVFVGPPYKTTGPISPAGFHASAPVFCDTPQGLMVIFTVGVGGGADLIATDTSGANMRRLTQGHGSNAYPACSPDGRLVAFFSTGPGGKSPGTYVAPITNPGRVRKVSDEHGESLAWAR